MVGKDELDTSINAKPQPRQIAVSPETCATAHRLDLYIAKSVRSLMMCLLPPPSAIIIVLLISLKCSLPMHASQTSKMPNCSIVLMTGK
eukprot:5276823-Ditylum_brightwellii.AAC.1